MPTRGLDLARGFWRAKSKPPSLACTSRQTALIKDKVGMMAELCLVAMPESLL